MSNFYAINYTPAKIATIPNITSDSSSQYPLAFNDGEEAIFLYCCDTSTGGSKNGQAAIRVDKNGNYGFFVTPHYQNSIIYSNSSNIPYPLPGAIYAVSMYKENAL